MKKTTKIVTIAAVALMAVILAACSDINRQNGPVQLIVTITQTISFPGAVTSWSKTAAVNQFNPALAIHPCTRMSTGAPGGPVISRTNVVPRPGRWMRRPWGSGGPDDGRPGRNAFTFGGPQSMLCSLFARLRLVQRRAPTSTAPRSRSWYLRTLPPALRGRVSTSSTRRGTL